VPGANEINDLHCQLTAPLRAKGNLLNCKTGKFLTHNVRIMSALPLKADMCGALGHTAKGHKRTWLTYSITSSAAFSRQTGTVRPRVLAVFRLITKSNLLGCKTGRSAGFGPI
jgi:hypothetical protein